MFVDFSGKRPWVVDSKTGQGRPVELVLALLGGSNLTFVMGVESQSWWPAMWRESNSLLGWPGPLFRTLRTQNAISVICYQRAVEHAPQARPCES